MVQDDHPDFWLVTRTDRFDQLPESAQQALRRIGVLRSWRSGRTLLHAGEAASSAFVVERGRLRVRRFGRDGTEQILGWLGPGTLSACSSVIAGVSLPFDIAADGACEVMHLERAALLTLLEHDASASLAIARILSARLARSMQRHVEGFAVPLADKVWSTLWRLASWQPSAAGTRTAVIEITQSDLAQTAGASRFRVGQALQRLEQEGRIRLERGRITVIDRPPAL